MPYQANKTMNLSGTIYEKGTRVPDQVFQAIAPHRQGALLRTKLVLEVESVRTSGVMCPTCGEGPFSRLAQHLSLKHPDVDLGLEVLSGPDSEEE